jgi:hypothetical protein
VIDRVATWELNHPGESWWDQGLALDDEDAALPPALSPAESASLALREGRADEAESAYRALASANAKDASAWLGVAHAAAAQRHLETSAAALGEVARLGALSRTARFDVAKAYADAKSFRASLEGLRARVRWSPTADALVVLSWFEAAAGESEEARLDAEAALRLRPSDPAAQALAAR